MFGRRSTRENATGSTQIPAGIVDLLEVVDAEYLLLAPGEIVVRASDASTTLGLVRDGKLVSNEILNIVRESKGLNTFAFRPHAGETGDAMHLAATYMLCRSINHGINLDKQVRVVTACETGDGTKRFCTN